MRALRADAYWLDEVLHKSVALPPSPPRGEGFAAASTTARPDAWWHGRVHRASSGKRSRSREVWTKVDGTVMAEGKVLNRLRNVGMEPENAAESIEISGQMESYSNNDLLNLREEENGWPQGIPILNLRRYGPSQIPITRPSRQDGL